MPRGLCEHAPILHALMQHKTYSHGRDCLLGQQLQMFDADMGIQVVAPAPSHAELAQDRRSIANLTMSTLDHMLQMLSHKKHHRTLQLGIVPKLGSQPRNRTLLSVWLVMCGVVGKQNTTECVDGQ